jgi:hypothetical protein
VLLGSFLCLRWSTSRRQFNSSIQVRVFGQLLKLFVNFSGNLTGSEVVAVSGTAIVYFTSDLAFNLRGFNVSYTYDDQCLYGCSGNGQCDNGVCICNNGYAGDYCETVKCTKDQIAKQDNGEFFMFWD